MPSRNQQRLGFETVEVAAGPNWPVRKIECFRFSEFNVPVRIAKNVVASPLLLT